MTESREVDFRSGMNAFEAKHFTIALRFLSPFAEAGNAEAQYRMAIMYQNGLGVLANNELAFKNMLSAAEQGLDLAQHGLGFMYMEGECVEQDGELAVQWFLKAAEQGLVGSQATLAMLYEEGNAGVTVDIEKAKLWYRKAGFDEKADQL